MRKSPFPYDHCDFFAQDVGEYTKKVLRIHTQISSHSPSNVITMKFKSENIPKQIYKGVLTIVVENDDHGRYCRYR